MSNKKPYICFSRANDFLTSIKRLINYNRNNQTRTRLQKSVSLRAKYTIMDRIQDLHALEERIYELVDAYLQEADCYATAPVLAVWKRCGKLNVAVDVETNLKLTKIADVFPIADVLRPTEDGTAQEPDNDKIAEIASVWFDVR